MILPNPGNSRWLPTVSNPLLRAQGVGYGCLLRSRLKAAARCFSGGLGAGFGKYSSAGGQADVACRMMGRGVATSKGPLWGHE